MFSKEFYFGLGKWQCDGCLSFDYHHSGVGLFMRNHHSSHALSVRVLWFDFSVSLYRGGVRY